MARKKMYKMRGTNGEEIEYTYKEMFDLVKDYLLQYGSNHIYVDDSAVDAEIPRFIARFTKVVKDEPQQEDEEAETVEKVQ